MSKNKRPARRLNFSIPNSPQYRRYSVPRRSALNVTSIRNTPPLRLTPIVVRSPTPALDDRRLFHFDKMAVSALRRGATRLVVRQNPLHNQLSQTKALVAFADPDKVHICLRRRVRKQIMHALGKAGKGSRLFKKPRRNEFSSVHCG